VAVRESFSATITRTQCTRVHHASDDAICIFNRETGFIEQMRYKRTTVSDHNRASENITIKKRE
jgi:hypothetical protein